MINMFDIYLASLGGLLIGVATTIHYLFLGKATGFSGIYYSIITFDLKSIVWKISLLAGVVLTSSTMFIYYSNKKLIPEMSGPLFDSMEEITDIGIVGSIVAGLLVGFGTKLGNGCTSGHGVCGLPRLSIRSSMAVLCFMSFGIITASIKQFIIETPQHWVDYNTNTTPAMIAFIISLVLIIVCLISSIFNHQLSDTIFASLVGLIFGLGLVLSGMVKRTKIIGFLTLNQDWDPSLLFVMIFAVGFNFITFRLKETPILMPTFEVPSPKLMYDKQLVIGEIIFGIGWGIGGLCPGPAIALFPQFTYQIGIIFLVCLAIGQMLSKKAADTWFNK